MQFERINPLTNEVASRAEAMRASDARAIGDRAALGFAKWSATGPNARREVLMKAATALEAHKQDFVQAMMAEAGATAGRAETRFSHPLTTVSEAATCRIRETFFRRNQDAGSRNRSM